jgi:polysaccharide biosynthesis transport protein
MSNQPSSENSIVSYGSGLPQQSDAQLSYPYALDGYTVDQPVPIRAYLDILLRHRWTVLTTVIIITTLVAIASFRMKPVYRATVKVEIDSEVPQIQSMQDIYQQMPTDEDFLRTQIQVLETDQLAWRTIEQLGLANDEVFNPTKNRATADPIKDKARLIDAFKGNLAADLVPSSRILRVAFESTDPQLAARVANGLVDNYIEYNFREKYDATRQASARMEQQLDELKAKVEKSQQALVDYQRQHTITNVNDKQNVVEQRLSELSADFSKAQGDRMQKESLYNVLRTDPTQIASVAQNDLLQKLQERRADLNIQYTEALNQYGPSFPKVVRLQNQLAEADAQIQKEWGRMLAKIRNDYSAAQGRERLVAQEVGRQKEEVGNLNGLLVQQNILQGEFESNQKMYQTLLQRLKDATVSAGLRSANVHLVDPAMAPIEPVRPRKMLNISIALLVGLLAGIGLVLVQESIDSSVKTSEAVESIVGAPTLAIVPKVGIRGWQQLNKALAAPSNGASDSAPALAILSNPRSAIAEAYRALRTSVLLSARDHRAILITSANAGEGKTSTAINFAMSLGQAGESTLLVDCDLRRPNIARILNLDNRKGLSGLLAGRSSFDQAVQPVDGAPNVSVVPSGPTNLGPAELLGSAAMQAFLKEALEKFTYVILDSPPMLAVTDASILANLADGVLLVVESGVTPKRAIAHVRRLIDITGAKLVGVVMNKIDMRDAHYYGYYGYGKYGKYGGYYSSHDS